MKGESKMSSWADLFANTPGGIVAGERVGGRALVMDDKLPLRGIHDKETRAKLEAIGFQFGEETGGTSTDSGMSMYIECKLPDAWRRGADPDDHYGRGSYLFDPQGRKRASMFTKETSYDRYASISLLRRYGVKDVYVDASGSEADFNKATHIQIVLTDCDNPFKLYGKSERDDYPTNERLRKEAWKELAALYPNVDDPFAYWEIGPCPSK